MRKLLITILFTSLVSLSLKAQGGFSSENGLFTINYLKGCVGTQFTITPSPSNANDFFCFEADLSNIGSEANNNCLNQQANLENDSSYVYNEPGTYNILFFRQLGNNQQYDSITIQILDPQVPSISAINCNDDIIFDLNSSQESFDFYTIDFGDGSTAQEYPINNFPITHTYADNSQSYAIAVEGRLDNSGFNNCGNTQSNFSIVPDELGETAALITSLVMVDESSFSIDYELNNYQNYNLQLKETANGSYQDILFISRETTGSYTFQNLSLNESFYCARIISESACNNNTLTSNEACTILFEGEAQQEGNSLNWNSTQFQSSSLFKNGTEIHSGPAPYLDENVLCGQDDTYFVQVTDSSGLNIQSFEQTLTALSGDPALSITEMAVTTLSDNEVLLSWLVPQGIEPENFVVYKKRSAEEDFFLLDSAKQNEYTDVGSDFSVREFFYAVTYTNNCGGIADVVIGAQNIVLTAGQEGSNLTLNWNDFTGYGANFSNYIVRQYDENMNLINSFDVQSETSFEQNLATSDIQRYIYQVEAISSSGLVSYSNELAFKIPATFFVPTAFTPNNDGRNEELKVLGKFIDKVDFKVFNRWGNLLFQTTILDKGWDGYLTNREAPEGTYTYTLTVIDQYGEEYNKNGTVNLIR